MRKIRFSHVRKFDNGKGSDKAFTLGSAVISDECGRLVGDLALLTRPLREKESDVDFDNAEVLANEALGIAIQRIDYMRQQLGLAEAVTGELKWFPWFEDNGGLLRKPTRNEVINLEGESQILYNGIDYKNLGYEKGIRLLAAFGLFCCERALDAETRGHLPTIIEMYSAAGVLLGHANYLVGCLTATDTWDGRHRDSMRLKGLKRWEAHPQQLAKAEALKLWIERNEGKHPNLRTVEQYAIEVARRWPVLTSIKVICTWSAKLSKDVKLGKTPAC